MIDRWFYMHRGRMHGPVGGDALNELAEFGELDADDEVWRVEERPAQGSRAGDVLLFFISGGKPRPRPTPPPDPTPPPGPAPPWLGELADTEAAGGRAPAPPDPVDPADWLGDVRRAEERRKDKTDRI